MFFKNISERPLQKKVSVKVCEMCQKLKNFQIQLDPILMNIMLVIFFFLHACKYIFCIVYFSYHSTNKFTTRLKAAAGDFVRAW